MYDLVHDYVKFASWVRLTLFQSKLSTFISARGEDSNDPALTICDSYFAIEKPEPIRGYWTGEYVSPVTRKIRFGPPPPNVAVIPVAK